MRPPQAPWEHAEYSLRLLHPLLEELTLNARPSPQRVIVDGWVLNFGDGLSRGGNAIFPLYPSSTDVDEKIATCEELYGQRKHETVFRVSSLTSPHDLDARLDARGYKRIAQTSAQVADLGTPPLVRDDAAITVSTDLDDAWLDDLWTLSATPAVFQPSAAEMLRTVALPRAYATLRHGGSTVGIGLAVVERGYLGLWDIIVAYELRNRGFGQRIMAALLAWGRWQGARHAHLAVLCDNAPALHLYARLGFHEVYQYWYRYKRVSFAPPLSSIA